MSESTWFIIAIVIYMAAMLAIGLWSYRKTTNYDDYVLADRGLHPFVAALSAGASDMSGWLLMGLPGALFATGLSELWLAIGLLIGSFLSWTIVAPRLRSYSEVADNSITLPSFFENRVGDKSRVLRIVSAIIIIIFFAFYVSSGMVAGGRYFVATFDGSYLTGLFVIGIVTVAYTFVGGFLAVSYTDVVQGTIMFVSLLIVPIMALVALDSPGDIFSWAVDNPYGPFPEGNPDFFNIISGVSAVAIISNLAWGLGYFGQPHIVVRYMALRKPSEAKAGRNYGIAWMFLCILGATFVAIVGTTYFGQKDVWITDQDAFETIFLDMGRILFHPLIAGLVLTAVLAAIMSTMSSQLLVVSSSLIEDLYKIVVKKKPSDKLLIALSRGAVIVVAAAALLYAIEPNDSILGLVSFAWAGFGSAFGPLMLFSLFWKRLNAPGAIAGIIVGAVVSLVWGTQREAWNWFGMGDLYEMIPGFGLSALTIVVVSLLTAPPSQRVQDQFTEATRLARAAESNSDLDIATAKEKLDQGKLD